MQPESQSKGDLFFHIDRESYEPAYRQLANILRRQISEGLFRPGDQLPSESQLCQSFGISPMTVRRAINLLADQGVVTTSQGRGTFVAALELSTAIFDLQDLESLFTSTAESHFRILDAGVVSADERTARKLGLNVGDYTIYIRRLFLHQSQPIFYHRAYLVYDPDRPILESELDVESLQGLFISGSSDLLKHGQLSIEATLMSREEANLLNMPFPSAAFYLEHIFYGFKNRPHSWGWFIIPSNRLHFKTHIGI